MVPAKVGSPLASGNSPRTESLNSYFVGNPAEGGASASSPPFELVAAFYSGVRGGGVQPLTAPCTSGNCTWPLTPSLAVDGGCQVNTSYAPPVCFDGCSSDYLVGSTHKSPSNCSKHHSMWCNYTMLSGSTVTLFNWHNETLQVYVSGALPGFQAISGTGSYNDASNVTLDDRMYFANFDFFGAPYASYQTSGSADQHHSECALWMCVEVYNTSVEANGQRHEVVSTMKYHTTSLMFDPLPASADPNDTKAFGIPDNVALGVLEMWTQCTMNGGIGLNLQSQTFSSDLMKGVWNSTQDPDALIANIAMSMTNVIRQANQTTRAEYNGTGYQLGVSVRWAWLSVPAVLVFLSIASLVTVMIRITLSPVAPWKGRPLTLLLMKIPFEVKAASYGQAHEPGGIQRAVGSMPIRLHEDPGRSWTFKAT